MTRKRLTQRFPWLVPLRQKQRRFCYFTAMALDRNTYAKKQSKQLLPNEIYTDRDLMINRNSGFDLQFQYNKAFNLKLAAAKISGLVIAPGEIFSLCYTIRNADKPTPYRDGLSLINGKITSEYGGGLCQMSILLHRMFLHTPLTVIERHGHDTESIPPTNNDLPVGIDATIAEGWLDLRIKNQTPHKYQIVITFDGDDIVGKILSDTEKCYDYELYNPAVSYERVDDKIIERATVARKQISRHTGVIEDQILYENTCFIDYPLPDYSCIKEN